ncbi:MAG: hypothetical protein WBD22_14285 [Pyrinomonadaceae bacterium]
MARKKKKVGTCVYCGETRELTREHVIARCLFPGPLPSNIVLVPVCDPCNQEKAKHDDYLRDMLAVDVDTSKSNEAQTLLTGKVFRSAETNRSQVMRAAKSNGKFESIYSKGGIYLGQGYSFPIDGQRVNHIFSLIIRGLYYTTTSRLLPQDCEFEVRRLSSSEFNEIWKKLEKVGYNGPYHLEGVLTCIFNYAAEEPAVSHWWLWFYDSVCVYVSTQPTGFDINVITTGTAKSI